MLGSSPRMRGTHAARVLPGHRPGIIPAYAGNTRVRPRSDRRPWDHPRVCGEHVILHQLLFAVRGSSPRMRGTPARSQCCVCCPGIIPAYAGNTCLTSGSAARRRDHPRVCGEHEDQARILRTFQGSSPRMRGTQTMDPPTLQQMGIIPAYAGNTTVVQIDGNKVAGSSPRMRGTPFSPAVIFTPEGIIPAYAGNTLPPAI